MGSRNPDDVGDGPFYNGGPIIHQMVKSFQPIPTPSDVGEDCATRIAKATGCGLGMGIAYNLIVTPWQPDPVEHVGKGMTRFRDNWRFFFRGFPRPMAAFSAVAVTFTSVECIFETIRDPEGKAKHWNAFAGGFAAGMVAGGMGHRRLDYAVCAGMGTGALMGSVTYNGMHYVSDPHQAAMKVAGVWPKQYIESKELRALKEKYPEYADL